MKNILLVLLVGILLSPISAQGAEPPDYRAWGNLLTRYYDPAKGMNYKDLKEKDKAALDELRRKLSTVDTQWLSRPDQLAYWINLYNISTVGIVVDNYPITSIRDLSTDPLLRLNVFKKESVAVRKGQVSLDGIQNDRLRSTFRDARIHFALHCAAEGCPPIRPEPFVGGRIEQQLDDQVGKFLNGPLGVRLEKSGGATLIVHTTKLMDKFERDFAPYGGPLGFIKRYAASETSKAVEAAGNQVKLVFEELSWKLNDASQ